MPESVPPQPKVLVNSKSLPEIHYVKSNEFRVAHCDGVFGALTPHGLLGMSFFSERVKLPSKSVLKLDSDGRTIRETPVETKPAIEREIEIQVILTVDIAESIGVWLEDQVKQARRKSS